MGIPHGVSLRRCGRAASSGGTQSVQDHRHVDRLLHEGAGNGREQAGCGKPHADETQPQPHDDRLFRDEQRPSANAHGFGYTARIIDEEHDISRFCHHAAAVTREGDAHGGR